MVSVSMWTDVKNRRAFMVQLGRQSKQRNTKHGEHKHTLRHTIRLIQHGASPTNEPRTAPFRRHQGIALPHFSLIEDSVYSQLPHNGGILFYERRL